MTAYKLIILSGPDGGNEFTINGQTSVGRSSECGITVRDPSLSREHFLIDPNNGNPIIKDLNSSNGTFLDGRLTKETEFETGVIISAGNSEFTVADHFEEAHLSQVKSVETTLIPAGDGIGQLLAHPSEYTDLVILYRTARNLPMSKSLSDLGNAILEPLCSSLKATGGSIYLIRPDKKIVEGARWSNEDATFPPPSKELFDKTLNERENTLLAYDDGSKAMAALMEASGKLFGALYLFKNAPTVTTANDKNTFTNSDLSLVSAIGEIGGPALANLLTRIRLASERGHFHKILRESAGIKGESATIREIIATVSRLASTDNPVLILGETGTGKELVAKAIHYNGKRSGNPIISVNCASLSDDIAESELFGHVKGAFTGATANRKGRFELASKGTLFLDEIGELSMAVQGKLLRVLENATFSPVGSSKEKTAHVRIIGATNRNLVDLVNEGTFRKDLYFRLNGFELTIPPLRERKEDIPVLAHHFLQKIASESGLSKTPQLSERTLNLLTNWPWPGNIRELSNVIERMVVLGEGHTLDIDLLPEEMIRSERTDQNSRPIEITTEHDVFSLEECERLHIDRILKHTQWNKKRAAELLGIERATLYKKIRKYELTPS